MRIGIVSYFTAPQGAVATHRVLRMTRTLLGAGHQVHWITLDEARLAQRDATLAELIPPEVVRHGLGGPTLCSRPQARNLTEKVLRSLVHELPRWFALPDRHVEWAMRLKRRLPRLVAEQGIDVVILSCGPHGQILSIPAVRRAAPRARIIVDYRDLLSGNVWNHYGTARVQRRLLRRERALLRQADALFVNSEEALTCFHEHVGELPYTPQVMRNGADFDLAEEVDRRWPAVARGEGIQLGYFGTIYPRRRLKPVIQALGELSDEVLARTTLHVYDGKPDSRRMVDEDLASVRPQVQGAVQHHGQVPYGQALATMRSMTALVLVNGADDADNIFVPAKLYDYLMSRRPILFVGNIGDAWRIVADSCGPERCFSHSEIAELAAAITALEDRPEDLEPALAYGTKKAFAPLLEQLSESEPAPVAGAKP